ncbi:hypothetical protein [Sphingomonas sp. 66-10]|uniref:hypothetical protein n=1 Tax=Sphingomonas sp. 66-10 TaxID=1895848 RepID=UPI000A42706D|nr:hypothetical protein [Sphingomonas sp. 66-10]
MSIGARAQLRERAADALAATINERLSRAPGRSKPAQPAALSLRGTSALDSRNHKWRGATIDGESAREGHDIGMSRGINLREAQKVVFQDFDRHRRNSPSGS